MIGRNGMMIITGGTAAGMAAMPRVTGATGITCGTTIPLRRQSA
jgi:hypothetical protein